MKTFTEPKALVENPHYRDQRRRNLESLTDDVIDRPIVGLINAFNQPPYCFTLQSCCGHFVYNGQNDPKNLETLPTTDTISTVAYRIAYVAFCIAYNPLGKRLLDVLKTIAHIDPDNIQFGCAEWFWERQINSYVLQVEPDRFRFEDRVILDYKEALKIERVRNEFLTQLYMLLQKETAKS